MYKKTNKNSKVICKCIKKSSAFPFPKMLQGVADSFSQNYVTFCQIHSIPASTDILTLALDSKGILWIEIEKLKRDQDWVPIMKAIKKDKSLREFVLYSNQGLIFLI